jgi:hypothetical protein
MATSRGPRLRTTLGNFCPALCVSGLGLQHQQGEENNAVREVGISADRISLETRKAGVL